MSVKDILQSLVDDAMVDSERIGTSNYFWAFPSKALHARKRRLETLESQVILTLSCHTVCAVCCVFAISFIFLCVIFILFFICIIKSKKSRDFYTKS